MTASTKDRTRLENIIDPIEKPIVKSQELIPNEKLNENGNGNSDKMQKIGMLCVSPGLQKDNLDEEKLTTIKLSKDIEKNQKNVILKNLQKIIDNSKPETVMKNNNTNSLITITKKRNISDVLSARSSVSSSCSSSSSSSASASSSTSSSKPTFAAINVPPLKTTTKSLKRARIPPPLKLASLTANRNNSNIQEKKIDNTANANVNFPKSASATRFSKNVNFVQPKSAPADVTTFERAQKLSKPRVVFLGKQQQQQSNVTTPWNPQLPFNRRQTLMTTTRQDGAPQYPYYQMMQPPVLPNVGSNPNLYHYNPYFYNPYYNLQQMVYHPEQQFNYNNNNDNFHVPQSPVYPPGGVYNRREGVNNIIHSAMNQIRRSRKESTDDTESPDLAIDEEEEKHSFNSSGDVYDSSTSNPHVNGIIERNSNNVVSGEIRINSNVFSFEFPTNKNTRAAEETDSQKKTNSETSIQAETDMDKKLFMSICRKIWDESKVIK